MFEKKRKNMNRLSFITSYKIGFLLRLPVLVLEKYLEKCLGIEIFDIFDRSKPFFQVQVWAITVCRFYYFFVYGVLYYRVQLCLAAINMLVFFTSASQRKNDCKYNFRVFRAVFSGLSSLVLIEELTLLIIVIWIILFFLNVESLKVLQRKGRKNHSIF